MANRDDPPADLTARLAIGRLRETIEALEAMADHPALLAHLSADEHRRLREAAGRVQAPDVRDRRALARALGRARRAARTARDEALLQDTGIRALRRRPAITTPNVFPPALPSPEVDSAAAPGIERETREAIVCYICHQAYTVVHHFYDRLCPACAAFNLAKRTELADLRGRVALLTGGRVKIGYQAGLKLLRCGASLIVTTRFPRDAATRYAQEPDFAEWRRRVEIFGLDLRHTPSVEAFCRTLVATRSRLDFIINNACQTVRRPPEFYAHMLEREQAALQEMPAHVRPLLAAYEDMRGMARPATGPGAGTSLAMDEGSRAAIAGLTHAAQLSQVPLLPDELDRRSPLFPEGQLDQDLQQVDLRDRNSWRLLLAEVSTVELLEVQLVNAVGPYVLNARLKPLLVRTPERDKHIVNVSAVEGQFYRRFKTTRHPHTNMAKAALNMMTRTSAADYHADGIHMNSVDTGWVTDEDPVPVAARKQAEQRFHPPLDSLDGAARIVDPIIDGCNTGQHAWGQFLKDYRPTDW